ncbi:MAG: cytochrome c [Bacteroidetes bacterium]|nr:cytochrome c [Bacteroidota bacterium]
MISNFKRILNGFLALLIISSGSLVLNSCNNEADEADEVAEEVVDEAEEEEGFSDLGDLEESLIEPGGISPGGMEGQTEGGIVTPGDMGDAKLGSSDFTESMDDMSKDEGLLNQNTTKEIREEVTTNKTKEEVGDNKTEKEIIIKKEKEVIQTKTLNIPADGWKIPAKYLSMKNPMDASNIDMNVAKSMYSKYCKSCHGATGKGDGPKSLSLDSKMRSFKSPEFKLQKPGVIYYKSFIGRDEMPNFEKKITDEEDRWLLINYMLSL